MREKTIMDAEKNVSKRKKRESFFLSLFDGLSLEKKSASCQYVLLERVTSRGRQNTDEASGVLLILRHTHTHTHTLQSQHRSSHTPAVSSESLLSCVYMRLLGS